MFLIICVALSLEATLKQRVILSALLPIMIIILPISMKKLKGISFISVFITLICAVNIFSFISKINYDSKEKEDFNTQKQLFNLYFDSNDKTIVIMPGSIDLEYLNPFKMSNFFKNKKISVMGWLSAAPFNSQILSHQQFLKDNVIFIKKTQLKVMIPSIINGLRLNYHRIAQHKIIMENDGYAILEIR